MSNTDRFKLKKSDLPVRPVENVLKRTDKVRKMARRKDSQLAKDVQARNRKEGKYCQMILRDINRNVKNNFNAFCKLNGTFMNAALEDYMRVCGNSIATKTIIRKETKRGRQGTGNGTVSRAFRPKVLYKKPA